MTAVIFPTWALFLIGGLCLLSIVGNVVTHYLDKRTERLKTARAIIERNAKREGIEI